MIMKSCILILVLILFLLKDGKADVLLFMRNLTCIEFGGDISEEPPCKKWNQTTKMYFFMDYYHLCFPQGTLVQTEIGPKFIQDLIIGDHILSYNSESETIGYSPVLTWISRDQEALSVFTEISMRNDETKYLISPLHNIAYRSEEDNEIAYTFANTLEQGMKLATLSSSNERIEQINDSQQLSGLYAPLTKNSNFFIYPYGTNPANANREDMILVHCYSQIQNPTLYQHYITPLLQYTAMLVDEEKTHFANPFYYGLRYLLGESWVDQNKSVRYDVSSQFDEDDNLQMSSYALEKGGRGSRGGGSRSSRSSTIHHGTSSSTNRHRYRKKSAIKVFSLLSIMKNTIFNV